MQSKEKAKANSQKKSVTKVIIWIFAVIILLIVVAALLMPVLISSKAGQKIILAKINNAIDGRMEFADLSLGWLKGVNIADLSFDDSVGRISVRVKQIATKPHYASILMGNLFFGKTTIDQPKISLNLKDQPTVGQERVGKAEPVPVKAKHIALAMDVAINDGSLKVTDAQGAMVELSDINTELNLRPLGQQTDLDLNMSVIGGEKAATIRAAGGITPGISKTGWSLKGTTGDLTVEVNGLDLGTLAPIFALTGVELKTAGSLWVNISSEVVDGSLEKLDAAIRAKDIDIGGGLLKGDRLQSNTLEVNAKLSQQKQMINIDKLQLYTDWASVTASGTIPTTLKSLSDLYKADSSYKLEGEFDCDLASLLNQIPHTVGLKEGMKVTSGKLTGNVDTFKESGKATISGQTKLVGLAGALDGKETKLTEPIVAGARITADDKQMSLERLNISAAFATVNASGNFEQVDYEGEVDLAKLQTELGQFADIVPYDISGRMSSKGQVSLKQGNIGAVGSVDVTELHIASADGNSVSEQKAEASFAVNIDRENNMAAIDYVRIKTSLGSVNVEDATAPLSKTAKKPLALAVVVSEVDLAKAQPFAVMFASMPKKIDIAGTASGKVNVGSQEDSYRIATDNTTIKNLKIASGQKEPFEQAEVLLILDAEVSPKEKSINVKKLQLESPQIKIKKGEFEKTSEAGQTRLQGQVDLEYDWAAVSTVGSLFLPEGLKLEGQRKTTVMFSSRYQDEQKDQLLGNLNAKAALGFDQGEYMGLKFGPTEVDVQVQKGVLNISPFSTTVNNGRLSFAGEANFNDKPTLLRTPGPIQIAKDIQIDKETTEKLFQYVNPIFANAVNVSGVANFDCDSMAIPLASATKNDLEVVGTISISKLYLQASDLLSQILSVAGGGYSGQEITVHPTKFALKEGSLQYDNMQVDVGDNPINFEGVIGLDKRLNMIVTLPYTLTGTTVRVGQEKSGERISVPLKGTIDKPELDLARLLEDQMKKQLQQQLRKGLEGLFK